MKRMFGRSALRLSLLLSSLLLSLPAACGSDEPLGSAGPGGLDAGGASAGEADAAGPVEGCVPTREAYELVRPLFVQWCSTCHTTTPQFGAPFSLLEYESVAGSYQGETIASHVEHVIRDGIMPPQGQPQPPEADRETLLAFGRCGEEQSGDVDGGHMHGEPKNLEATREPLVADETPPEGATSKDLTAGELKLAADARDRYESFDFTNLAAEDRFIQRFDPILDDTRVVHHLTLRFVEGRSGYLYTWAPGGPAIEFPDGGVRLSPNDTLRLEIHYNNGGGFSDVSDSSGVRLWLGAPNGTEYGIASLATWSIFVPAGGTSSASHTCNVQNDVHIFAAAPHMHGIGDSFSHTIKRAGGASEDLVSLTGWSFDAQRYYAIGVDLKAGDKLEMRCNYNNTTQGLVTAGPGTDDEMCFDFMYVTPPTALANCNDSVSL
jgi:hypothetical protein